MKFLSKLIASAKSHPIYWIGGALGATYLLTNNSTSSESNNVSIGPEPYSSPYNPIVAQDSRLPKTSPDGAPWILWKGPTKLNFSDSNFGMDANGRFWTYGEIPSTKKRVDSWGKVVPCFPPQICTIPGDIGFYSIVPADLSSGNIIDAIGNAVKVYVLPAMALAASALIPGVGGVVAAAAISAAAAMARGASVTDALVNVTRDALPALRDNRAFDDAYSAADSLYSTGKNIPAVQSIALTAKSKLLTPEEKQAYSQGFVLATAKRNQQLAINALKKVMPEKASVIDLGMSHGAALIDVAGVLGGSDAINLMTKILNSTS